MALGKFQRETEQVLHTIINDHRTFVYSVLSKNLFVVLIQEKVAL